MMTWNQRWPGPCSRGAASHFLPCSPGCPWRSPPGEPAAWTAARCFPVKLTAPDLKSDANEVAIESIEIAHEGLKLLKS